VPLPKTLVASQTQGAHKSPFDTTVSPAPPISSASSRKEGADADADRDTKADNKAATVLARSLAKAPPAATPASSNKPAPAPAPPAAPVAKPARVEPAPAAVAPTPSVQPAPPLPHQTAVIAAKQEPLETDVFGAPPDKRRRVFVAVGALVVGGAFAGVMLSRRGTARPPAVTATVTARAPEAAAPAPPSPAASVALAPAPAPPVTRSAASAEAAPAATRPARAEAHPKRKAAVRSRKRSRHDRGRHTREVAMASKPERSSKVAAEPAPAGGGTDVRSVYQRGNDLLLRGDAPGAVTAYQEAIRLAPADPVGYRGLGLALDKQGQVEGAIEAFKRYLKLAPRSKDHVLIVRRIQRLAHPTSD
jgi:hypothetical protein